MQAWEIEEGRFFRWQNDVYRVEAETKQEEPHDKNDYIPVTRMASLWKKENNPWLNQDTWLPLTTQFIENFNPYAEVTPVRIRTVCEVTEIKKAAIIPAVEAAAHPTGK